MNSKDVSDSYIAGEDFTGDGTYEIGYCVKYNASREIVKCTVAGERGLGIQQSTGKTGTPVRVLEFGDGKGKANADLSALAPGTELSTATTGKLVAAIAGDFVFAVVKDVSRTSADGLLLRLSARSYYKHA